MATSGLTNASVTSHDTLRFRWWQSGQSIEGNYTSVSWVLELITDSYGRINSSASKSWSVNVNGSTYSGTNTVGVGNNSTLTLASGVTSVPHNEDGTKTFGYSFSQYFGITFSGSFIGTVSGSGSATLESIPRVSKIALSQSEAYFGDKITIVTYRNSTSFDHALYYDLGLGEGWQYIAGSITDSYEWEIPLDLTYKITNAPNHSISLLLETYNNGALIGNNVASFNALIPDSLSPTVDVLVDDAMGYVARYGAYVQGQSQLYVSINASGMNGATIESYVANIDGKQYTGAEFTTDVLLGKDTVQFDVSVKDSRKKETIYPVSIRVMPYEPPRISSLTIKRTNANGESNSSGSYLTAVFDAQVTRLDDNVEVGYRANEAVFKGKYVNKADSSDSNEEVFLLDAYDVQGGKYTFPANESSSYDFTLIVHDAFTQQSDKAATKTVVGGTTSKVFSILRRGLGFAFNKVAELEDFLDVNFKLLVRKGIWIDEQTQIDYIIEEGEKDGWFYRKWNSGIAECWKLYYENGVNIGANNFNGFYYSHGIKVSYPFTFTNLPTVVVDGGSTGNVNFVRIFGNYQDRANFLVIGLVSTTVDIIVSIRAIGKWK